MTASFKRCCLQGQDETEEQVQGQAGRCHVRAAHRRKPRLPLPVGIIFPLVQFICNVT